MNSLQDHAWPGNTRELKTMSARGMLIAPNSDKIDANNPVPGKGLNRYAALSGGGIFLG